MAAQVIEDGVAAELALAEAPHVDPNWMDTLSVHLPLINERIEACSAPGGVDLPELVEAEPLRLLHARRQGAQEVLGRHENLRQRE